MRQGGDANRINDLGIRVRSAREAKTQDCQDDQRPEAFLTEKGTVSDGISQRINRALL